MTTHHAFDPAGTVDGLRAAAARLVASGARALQVLGCTDNPWEAAALDAALRELPVPAFGGLFPGIVVDGASYARGTVVVGHAEAPDIHVVECAPGALAGARPWAGAAASAATLAVYVDATCDIGPVMAALFDEVGASTACVGGGAGALDFVRRPVVVTPGGLRAGVAVLAAFGAACGLGVGHGWEPTGASMVVTEAAGNDVISLDWTPAMEVYRAVVERHAGRPFDHADFYALASTYPLMLERVGGEGVVRDPLTALPDGRLRCAGDVQPHATIRVATGSPDSMLRAAGAARDRAVASRPAGGGGVALTIDCISRALLLGPRLVDELAALRVPGLPQVGALTIGEVASAGEGFLAFHNKTSVVAILSDGAAPA